jgi:cell division protease FtsH
MRGPDDAQDDGAAPPPFWRSPSFWVLVLLLPVAALSVVRTGAGDVGELTYSEFRAQLRAENVESVTVREGRGLEGVLASPVRRDGAEVRRFRTHLPFEADLELVQQLEDAGVQVEGKGPAGSWLAWGLRALPWILIAGIWLFLWRQMQGSGNRAFQFARSKPHLVTGETPEVTFDDVAGCEEALAELQEIVDFLKEPDRFSRLGGRLPKGALLVGPPGTGKTLLARAVAGEAGRPFFSMSGSDFVEMFVGVGAARVRDVFEQAKERAPCIVFIDELDAVGRHRGAGLGGGHDEREQTLNQLLVEMDGFESNAGVILLAATNRPDVLDPALLRPGRFDRQIVVDSPDVRGRQGILEIHTSDVPLARDVDLGVLARATPGLSGAQLANIVNEAALLAARRDRDRVHMDDFEEARDKVMLGAERRSLVISDEERRVTAYHEAGHAVVALRVPGLDPLHKVTIVPRGRALGLTASLPEEDRHNYTRSWLEGQLALLFGGRVAEETVFGPEKTTTGAGDDLERATGIARRMVTQFGMSEAVGPMTVAEREEEVFLGRDLGHRREVSERTAELVDAEVKRILEEAYATARATLEENRDLLEAVAGALLERETLEVEDIRALDEGRPLPGSPPGAEDAAPPAAAGPGAGPCWISSAGNGPGRRSRCNGTRHRAWCPAAT